MIAARGRRAGNSSSSSSGLGMESADRRPAQYIGRERVNKTGFTRGIYRIYPDRAVFFFFWNKKKIELDQRLSCPVVCALANSARLWPSDEI